MFKETLSANLQKAMADAKIERSKKKTVFYSSAKKLIKALRDKSV